MKDSFVILQGINLVDTITFINRKNKKFQATLLSQIEEVIDPESEKYLYIRKLVLDSFNNYTRAITKTIFGDIEDIIK